MKKGIPRLGLIFSFCLSTSSGFASSVSDLPISELIHNPTALSYSPEERLKNSAEQEIYLRGIDLDDGCSDLHRFDSDLLILPKRFLMLARKSTPGLVPDNVYNNFRTENGGDDIVLNAVPTVRPSTSDLRAILSANALGPIPAKAGASASKLTHLETGSSQNPHIRGHHKFRTIQTSANLNLCAQPQRKLPS